MTVGEEIPCPSGFRMLVKPMGGKAINAIARRSEGSASGDAIGDVLAFSHVETTDQGEAYTDRLAPLGKARPRFTDMLYGDTIVAILRLRIASFPDIRGTYEFDFACRYRSECGQITPWEINLEELLASDLYKPLPAESAEAMKAGHPIERRLRPTSEYPNGRRVHFDLDRLAHIEPLRNFLRSQERTKQTDLDRLAKQLRWIEGAVTGKRKEDIKTIPAFHAWCVENLDVDDIDMLLGEFEACDCGIDTELRVRCKHCGAWQDIELPLGPTFYRPRSRTRKVETLTLESSSEASSPASPSSDGATSSPRSDGPSTAALASTSSATATS